MSIDFVMRGQYDFDVYPSSILGNSFKRVTVIGIIDATLAAKESDIYARHAQCYASLPSGTPEDPSNLDFVKVRHQNGLVDILCMSWIIKETVTKIDQNSPLLITVNNPSPTSMERINNALLAIGETDFSIRIQGQ